MLLDVGEPFLGNAEKYDQRLLGKTVLAAGDLEVYQYAGGDVFRQACQFSREREDFLYRLKRA